MIQEYQEYFNTPMTKESRAKFIKKMSFEKYVELMCITLNKAGFKKEIRGSDGNYKEVSYEPFLDLIIVDVIKDYKALNYLKKVELLDNGRCPECGNTMNNTYKFISGLNQASSYYICSKCYHDGLRIQRSFNPKGNNGCMLVLFVTFILSSVIGFISFS